MSELAHVGKPHSGGTPHSGRYKWGSGEDAFQRANDFMGLSQKYKAEGKSETEIAKAFGMTTSEYRARKTLAVHDIRKEQVARAQRLRDNGHGVSAIGREMGLNESSVRSLLDPEIQRRQSVLMATANTVKESVDRKDKVAIDIGEGAALNLGISDTKLKAAVDILKEQGYELHTIKIQDRNNLRTMKVLAPPTDNRNAQWRQILDNRDKIGTIGAYTEDHGASYIKEKDIPEPKSLSSKRIQVVYGDKGGEDRDGLIELRRGVDDISLGNSRYSQVRIAVDGTHYIKGMAVYSDNLPSGVDVRFNTNKPSGTPLLGKGDASVLKTIKDDPDAPFKSVVRRPDFYTDKNGKLQQSVINKVNDEGDWDKWSRRFSSQMLSKQTPKLAKQQLDLTEARKRTELEEIMNLTNPVVKKKLLNSFADDCDSAATHLKAAALPSTSSHVILPVPGMKPTEVYAPNFKNGDRVVLIRHPHGGIFEIPELVVNNRSAEAKKVIPSDAPDAIGIHPKVAKQLSGADFDGDSVLVIPNNKGLVRSEKAKQELTDFDNRMYKMPPGTSHMKDRTLQTEMGKISNLITDMTIKGAPFEEISRAVKHSMVVIDAQKHELDYKQSAKDFGIAQLKEKYQRSNDGSGGASTLISRAGSAVRVPEMKPRPAAEGGPIDPKTGEKVFVPSGKMVPVKKNGEYLRNPDGSYVEQPATTQMKRLAVAKDARTLVSDQNTLVEQHYANYSNRMKAMGNEARKAMLSTPTLRRDPIAAKQYATEVASLTAKLNTAKKQKPVERQVLLAVDSAMRQKIAANPALKDDKESIKKLRKKETVNARARFGLDRYDVDITPKEWEAIQHNAVSNHFLDEVLSNANLDRVKQLATPKASLSMTSAKTARAKLMLDSGYTQAEVADQLGVSTSTLKSSLSGKVG